MLAYLPDWPVLLLAWLGAGVCVAGGHWFGSRRAAAVHRADRAVLLGRIAEQADALDAMSIDLAEARFVLSYDGLFSAN